MPRGWPRTPSTSCCCSRTCRPGTTPTTSRGCRWIGRDCASNSWPGCTPGRADPANASALEHVSEHRHPDRARPAGARVRAGLAGLPSTTAPARFRRASRGFAEDFAAAGGGGAACADRTRHAAARRHPGRQPVLRRRRDEGGRLPVRRSRLRRGRHRLPRHPGSAAVEAREGHDEALVREYLDHLAGRASRTTRSTTRGGTTDTPRSI